MGYFVLVLLAKVCTCMWGNQISMRFSWMPPTVEEYLALFKKEIDNFTKRKIDGGGYQ